MSCGNLLEMTIMNDALVKIKSAIKDQDSSSMKVDAFGRERVSLPRLVFNYYQHDYDQSFLTDTIKNGTGTSVWTKDLSSTRMSTAADGDYVIRQTFERFLYQSGSSTLIMISIDNFQPETNIVKRIGYFSNQEFSAPYDNELDGFFLESSGNNFYFVVYNKGTEISRIGQENWNIDKLDGTGASGVTLDKTKSLLVFFDFQWLGVGIVRSGFVVGGESILCNKSGNIDQNLSNVYMQSPIHPIRWEIRQTGVGSGYFDQICASVDHESPQPAQRTTLAGASGDTLITPLSTGTTYAMGALRLKSDRLNNNPHLLRFDLLSGTKDAFRWEIRRNPIIAGPSLNWVSPVESSLEVGLVNGNQNTITGGTILMSGLFDSTSSTVIDLAQFGEIAFGAYIDGTPIEIVLCVFPFVNNASAVATGVWREIY